MKTEEINQQIIESYSAKPTSFKANFNNHSPSPKIQTNKKIAQNKGYKKSNTHSSNNNNKSLSLTNLNKMPLTYTQNCSKELLILSTLQQNTNFLPNNYMMNPNTVLSILNSSQNRSCYLCKSNSLKLLNTLECPHLFCDVCIQLLINNNFLIKENLFKCPIIPCTSHFDQDILKVFFLSKDSLLEKIRTLDTVYNYNTNQSPKNGNKDNIRIYNTTKKLTSGLNPKLKNNAFLFFMKNKGRYCRNCYSDKLYSPIDKLTFICLNCSKRVCQKCYRYCDKTHFNVKYVNHCPILDSRKRKINNKTTCQEWYRLYCFELFSLIVGWLILFIGHVCNIKQFIFSIRKKRFATKFLSGLLDCMCYTMLALFIIIDISISIILLPYYSAILLLIDCNDERSIVK